jgi:hypothetical protein
MPRANPGNYRRTASEFLRALRGSRSQRALARRLGYRANPITDWEHGRRFPTAEEALRAAYLLGVDVGEAFARFHPSPPPDRTRDGYRLAPWLDGIRGSTPVVDLARRARVSRFALGRWLRAEARPRLPDFFCLVDAATGRLPDLVGMLVPIAEVGTLRARHSAAEAARRAAYEAPWTEAVLRVLESPGYRALARHEGGWIARRLGIGLPDEQHSLKLLRDAGAIARLRGLYCIRDPSSVDTRGHPESVARLLGHWSEVARGRIGARRADDWFAYNVCSLSDADHEQVRELLRRTYREIRSLVAASQPGEKILLLNLQLLALGGD